MDCFTTDYLEQVAHLSLVFLSYNLLRPKKATTILAARLNWTVLTESFLKFEQPFGVK